MKKILLALLIFSVMIVGCSKKTEHQAPPTPSPTPTVNVSIEEEKELANLTKEMNELEQMIQELEELENVSFGE